MLGIAKRMRNAVTSVVHVKIGMRFKRRPGARSHKIVTTKFTDVLMEDAPSISKPSTQKSTPTVGEYVTPLLVGGSRGSLYGNIIETFFGDGLNWPLGSAMALIMLVGVIGLVILTARLVDLRRFVG